ncbi:hypothetical protein BH23ACT5_BH23ACT5_10080 [soil metagenome]
MAAANGAMLLDDVEVTAIREVGGSVEVVASGRMYTADRVVIASGAWSNRLLGLLGVQYPLDVTLEQVVYLDASDPVAFHPARFPVWIWMDEPCFYGFPVFGEPAVKLAWDRCEVVTDPETRTFEPRDDVTAAVRSFAATHLPGIDGAVRLAKTCLYTLTPDRDFVIGSVPGCERVTVAIGAGHAFKFASLIGRVLADLTIDGDTDIDVTPFDPSRPILSEKDPTRSYMV